MRGNAHHVQMISSVLDLKEFREKHGSLPRRLMKRLMRTIKNPPTNVFEVMSILDGPALLLEYIPNGSLLQLLNRAIERDLTIPNRILWSFYFCSKKISCLPSQLSTVSDSPY